MVPSLGGGWMIRVAIIGATGYTAAEAALILDRHPKAELVAATSRSEVGRPLAEIHRRLTGRTGVAITEFDAGEIARQCDVALCCLPHGASAETVRSLSGVGVRVVDFSADFRLSSLDVYEHWYQTKHPWPQRFGTVPYGMPEFYADQIRTADVVANPGCYPTSAILPLVPLVRNDQIETEDIIVDAKSGVSGAGRGLKLGTLYCEVNESIAAYAVGKHRHAPEIADLVRRIGGQEIGLTFTPHLTPMQRGILSTIYVRPRGGADASSMRTAIADAYHASPFVQVVQSPPATADVAGTNRVHIAVSDAGPRVVITAAIDNLIKGASGAAIQNLNVMFGLPPETGLI